MRVLGLCAGNGVMIYPLKRYLIGNIEPRSAFYTKDNTQWKLNFGDIPMEYEVKEWPEADIVIGHPDCGHSSILSYSRKKSLGKPEENESLNLYIKGVKRIQPSIFLMENLPKLIDTYDRPAWENMFPEYNFKFIEGPVTMFGNSQKTRNRLLVIGFNREKLGGRLHKLQYHFSQIYKVKELKYADELIKGLKKENPKIGHVREDIKNIITMYSGYKISLEDAQRVWLNNPTRNRWIVKDRNFTTAPAVYINRKGSYPMVARKANRQFNHKGLQMTPRELARIQGVPDAFKIHIDMDTPIYWINKGRTTVTKTPPYEIGKWFAKQLKKYYNDTD